MSARDAARAAGRRGRAGRDGGRGRDATSPGQIPPRGWRDIIGRVRTDVKEDQVSLVAAGVAFFAMLSLFPALIAVISVYGLVVGPEQAAAQTRTLTELLPNAAADLIGQQLTTIAAANTRSLGIGLALSLAAALWSASSGMKALIEGVNIAYDETETRGFLKLRGLALLLTVGAIVFFPLAIGAIVAFPALAGELPGGRALELVANAGRWVILAALVVLALGIVFRFGPDRERPRFRWVTGGGVVAAIFWLLASVGFSFYVDNFGSYNETYGSLAAVVILLLWLYISAFVILLGAELNSHMELQTRRDSTTGPERPLGDRDAYAADHVAEPPERRR